MSEFKKLSKITPAGFARVNEESKFEKTYEEAKRQIEQKFLLNLNLITLEECTLGFYCLNQKVVSRLQDGPTFVKKNYRK